MHIAYYSPNWPPEGHSNGVTTYVNQMRRQMLARGHTVTIVSPQPAEGAVQVEAKDGEFLSRLCRKVQRRLDAVTGVYDGFASDLTATIKKIHAQRPIDILEIEESFGWAEHLRKALPFPVVVRLHGPNFLVQIDKSDGLDGFRDAMRRRCEGAAIRNAPCLTSSTAALLKEVYRYYGFEHPEAHVIRNPFEVCPPEARWRLDDSDPNLLLFVGRFDTVKGGDLALQAFLMLSEKFQELRLVVAGSNPGVRMADSSLLRIEQYVASQLPPHLSERIEYLGVKTPAELERLRRRARAVMIPSRFETAGYTLLEALALGMPVVSAAHFLAAQHIDDGVNGFLVPLDDAPALASGLEAVLSNPELAASMGVRGWQLCSERFNPEKICLETERLYRSLVLSQATLS